MTNINHICVMVAALVTATTAGTMTKIKHVCVIVVSSTHMNMTRIRQGEVMTTATMVMGTSEKLSRLMLMGTLTTQCSTTQEFKIGCISILVDRTQWQELKIGCTLIVADRTIIQMVPRND